MAVTKRKTYEIVNSTQRPIQSIDVGGRQVRFKRGGQVAYTDDAGVAKELNSRYGYKAKGWDGGKVVVTELEAYNENRHADPVRRTHYFTVPELPWKKGKG